jgi:S-methylmethionine-dependent homocysteine/selenocysteine methylase
MDLRAERYVTDGGMETDLIFHRGWDLPEFASFPLLDSQSGRDELHRYFDGYADVAHAAGAGFLVETATWRANPDHAAAIGYGPDDVVRISRDAVMFALEVADRHRERVADVLVGGVVGPRRDGYVSEAPTAPKDAEEYHRPQLEAFATAGADYAVAYTMTDPGEAIGVVRAARSVGLPVAISFTVETDGLLPSGDTLAAAIAHVDDMAPPDHFLVNCAHPVHIAAGLDDGRWTERIVGVRPNSSRLSHAELDAATELDEGDRDELSASHRSIAGMLPSLRIVGGCCGTDARHVAALWGVTPPS